MTAPVMWVVGEFRVLHWCRPMPACISGNKMWHPDDHLIWCPKVDSGPHKQHGSSTSLATLPNATHGQNQVKTHRPQLLKTTKLGVFPVFAVFYCWCAETRHFKTFVASNFSKKKNIGRVNRIHKQQLSRFSQQAIPFDLANRNTKMLIAKNAYQSRGWRASKGFQSI